MPLGTRGGIKFSHTFPADGEYRTHHPRTWALGSIRARSRPSTRSSSLSTAARCFEQNIGGPEDLSLIDRGGAPARAEIMQRFTNVPIQVKAGVHDVAITFVERSRGRATSRSPTFSPTQSFTFTGAPRVPGIVGGIDMIGPYESTGLSPTASREKLFVCEPEVQERERECAEQITANLARRAFRRPIVQADLDRLMPFYEDGRAGPGGFDEGIELMVDRRPREPRLPLSGDRAGRRRQRRSLCAQRFRARVAALLFLWSQGPDAELLDLAAAGRLSDAAVLDAQVARMLADPRAHVLVTSFAMGWLNVDDLEAVQPDKLLFPEFTEGLRADFSAEIEQFLASVLLEDRNVQTLLTADYTFANERLARHYGVPSVAGPQFRRVELENPTRHGLLGKGAVLLRTSYGDRTSPVLRGAWVLDKLLGTPPTPPPPGVETNLSAEEGEEPTTLRERLEQHRTSETCNACHGVI